MSYRPLQLSPRSTHGKGRRIPMRGPWSARLVNYAGRGSSERNEDQAQGGSLTWNKVLGLALVVTVGVGFWTAVGIAVAHAW
jgi:hypothetical protein